MGKNGYRKVITLGVNFTEFTGSATEVSRKLKVLDSEFGKTAVQAANMGTKLDQLGAKQDYLVQKFNLQGKAVDSLKTQYEALVEKYGENNKATEKSLIAYNKAKAAMGVTEEALKKVTKEVNTHKSAIVQLGDKLAKVGEEYTKFGDPMQKIGKGITAAVTVPMMAVGAALLKSADSMAVFADEIGVMSEKTGMSTQKLQEMKYVTNQLDMDFGAVERSMTLFTSKMRGVDEESGAAFKAMQSLRISLKDVHGATRPLNEVYTEAIDKLSKMKNASERNILASALFGKSWSELAPLLSAGGDEISRLSKRANELGLVMDGKGLNSAREYGDKMDELKMQFAAVFREVSIAFMPVMEKLMEFVQKSIVPGLEKFAERVSGVAKWFSSLTPEMQKAIGTIALIVATVGPLFIMIGKVASGIGSIGTLLTTFNPAVMRTTMIVIGIVAAFIALLAVIAALSGKSGEIERTFRSIGTGVDEVKNGISLNGMPQLPGFASGTDYYPGGRAIVGENGPEIVDLPQGSKIHPNGTGPSGGDTFNLNVNVDQVGDVVRLVDTFRQLKQTRRAGIVGVG